MTGMVFDDPANRLSADPSLRSKLDAETAVLTGLGVVVSGVTLPPGDGAPRFLFTVAPGKAHVMVRGALAREGFDVGNIMKPEMLSFYAARRTHTAENDR